MCNANLKKNNERIDNNPDVLRRITKYTRSFAYSRIYYEHHLVFIRSAYGGSYY